MRRIRRRLHGHDVDLAALVVGLWVVAAAAPGGARVRACGPQPKAPSAPAVAQVLVLGTYHFANPNLDYVKTHVDDHLAERRQREIAEVIDGLARFAPTRIALEATDDAHLAERYAAYRAGTTALAASEREQIGLRLAKRLGLPRVYAVDHKLDMDMARVMKAAQESGNRAFLAQFQQVMVELEAFQARQATMTVGQVLLEMNDPARLRRDGNLYLQLARVRGTGTFDGADVLAGWYQRNFRIFANLIQIVESPSDRVLVMFGAGHAPILRELVESSPDLRLVEPADYLTKRGAEARP